VKLLIESKSSFPSMFHHQLYKVFTTDGIKSRMKWAKEKQNRNCEKKIFFVLFMHVMWLFECLKGGKIVQFELLHTEILIILRAIF